MKLTIGYLYPDLMNIYGDTGNITTLRRRAMWRGIEVEIKNITVGDKLKSGEVDLYFFGGGQDLNQKEVAQDLQGPKGKIIKKDVEKGVPLLSICGGYQLLGEYYKPQKGPKLPGLGVFETITQAGEKRMIGNIVISSQFGELVGFENHSGKTTLKKDAIALGTVETGFGNNGEDKTEGVIYKNAIGCYMHGALLPKNPQLADWLIKKALEIKYKKDIEIQGLDDAIENSARDRALLLFK